MARAIWSGSVSFGLVSIPVKLYSATEKLDISFNQFEKGTGKRIHNKRVAGRSDREVPYEKIVKGYEVEKGEFVIVTPKELQSVEPTRNRTIEIEEFVDLDQIDPIYFDAAYYLVPDKERGAAKPYALLLKALEDSGKVAIGRFVLRTKEYLVAIRPKDSVLTLHTMLFADEVRDARELDNLPARARISEPELRIAKQLIGAQVGDWDPKRYRDRYRERVLKLIEKKAAGEEIVTEREAEPAKVENIMDALRASVEALKRGEHPADAASGNGSRAASKRTTKRSTKRTTTKRAGKRTSKRTAKRPAARKAS